MVARCFPGPMRSRIRARTWTVATNKTPIGPYRGVGRPGACFAVERVIDEMARAVGRDPIAVRSENMIQPSQMPYRRRSPACVATTAVIIPAACGSAPNS